ncbi:uncharacterized protein LOC106060355 isoform X1 [Biomphalaria glabrata]|uniref:Uncharacterized protein LOC106060355 isoform X1 n=2 Tax=Biomphalaria glabrata TaxID=6526 RepID=A0A9W3B9R2_BIOGL|nr:uncharacterized protein LOC106060355 isoform X1 [Biomphalaria glabrata]
MKTRYITHMLSPRTHTNISTRLLILTVFTILIYLFSLEKLKLSVDRSEPFIPQHSKHFLMVDPKSGAKSSCPFPRLELYDKEIMKFYVQHKRVTCAVEENWVSLHRGVFTITEVAATKHKNIRCDLFPVLKESDFKVVEGEPLKDFKNGTRITHDFFRVACTADDGAKYHNWHAGIRHDKDILKRKASREVKGLDVDVIMIGLDSVSRLAWQRHLPLTWDYFVNVLNGIEMEGYNILGDGTPAAIMPILIGKREEELHEARRGYPGAKSVDDFPWIWKEFKQAGYVTAWGEDDAHLGTFQYRLLGFNHQPTDHYYRYFSLAIQTHYSDFQQYCMGSRPRHAVIQDYMRELFFLYPKKRKFSFTFQSELSHRENNKLSQMDDDLYEHLKRLHVEKHLDNAILIMLADHGARFSIVRATAQGKQEERMPYFGIRFPEWFHKKYPQILQNVKNNSKRLTTPFDVHETLHEIINFTGTEKANISNRGVSLFKAIPEERNCKWAQIDPHWCSCMEWIEMRPDDPVLKHVVDMILSTFNNYTEPYRSECAVLKVKTTTSASMLKIYDAVLKYKGASDGGRGRFGRMDDTTQHSKLLYQVNLVTEPGDGLFETTLTYHLKENRMELNKKDISRINEYGKTSHCVDRKDSFLRPFCYCK